MADLPAQYNFKDNDIKWSRTWVEKNIFQAHNDREALPYVIMIPPPNVTGILHMGHALNNTLQDIIMRYKRMNGYSTLWMVGTDHAGIATQNVVEKKLAKEGKTRYDVGRDNFLKQVWEWKEEYGSTIIAQLKSMGSSCDWSRERFTMDDEYSNAVKKVFIQLYKKGLIYQGERIINWCPRCHTALSDEESDHQEHQGALTYIKYPFKDDTDSFITVATTRPETMLGDTAVAVNPNDERYKECIGKTLILPLINREIKVIADAFVDPKFGTGAVKVTPAHDPNDFAMGKRHKLDFINILDSNGCINDKGGVFFRQDRFQARKNIIVEIKNKGFFVKTETHSHSVGHCYRCDTVVEPILSKQWFVKMKDLAKPAIDVVKNGEIRFHPPRWEKTYMNWMDNIRDWCISRQIWWGHRIPVWYDEDNNVFVAENEEEALDQAKIKYGKAVKLHQDNDVLDTWFSSWLWPFVTLGWPEQTKDLKAFYPSDSLFTGSEIIFFWVARMIMAGIEFTGEIPFKDVYIHGTVRDAKGRKMSKSLGNALDPLEIIEHYGADALRFSLIINSGQDIFISKEKFETGRNFANKVWNASRLIMTNTKDTENSETLNDFDQDDLDLPSQWIISSFYGTLVSVGQAVEEFKYSEAESLIYDFFWNDLCDWYLEIIKDRWDDPITKKVARLLLEESLRMMNPFLPFVTEEVWQYLKPELGLLCSNHWPKKENHLINKSAEASMNVIFELVSAMRNIRAEWDISPKKEMEVFFTTKNTDMTNLLQDNISLIKFMAKLNTVHINDDLNETDNSATAIIHSIKCIIPLGNIIDIKKEKARLSKQIQGLVKETTNVEKRLNNKGFTDKAPQEVIEKDRKKLETFHNKIKDLNKVIKSFIG